MPAFLYKFMPIWPDFFDDLMIRATPASALNDPFETKFSKVQLEAALNNLKKHHQENGASFSQELDIDESMELIRDDLSEIGIISLTEDHLNPPMWAHYSAEHKGMVVEFSINTPFFKGCLTCIDNTKTRFGSDHFGCIEESPKLVTYGRRKPSFDRPENIAPSTEHAFYLKRFTKEIIFTKSNDWTYEKEHRMTVPLYEADRVIVKNPKDFLVEYCDNIPKVRSTKNTDGSLTITFPEGYEMGEDIGDTSIKREIFRRSQYPGSTSIHFFRINPLAITGVYFGCRSEYKEYLDKIRLNKSLKNLKTIKKMKICDLTFELEETYP